VTHYEAFDKSYRIQLDGRNSLTWVSRPEPCKRKMKILSPLRAFTVLLNNGWSFNLAGNLVKGDSRIEHECFHLFGTIVNYPEDWPSCILEGVK